MDLSFIHAREAHLCSEVGKNMYVRQIHSAVVILYYVYLREMHILLLSIALCMHLVSYVLLVLYSVLFLAPEKHFFNLYF